MNKEKINESGNGTNQLGKRESISDKKIRKHKYKKRKRTERMEYIRKLELGRKTKRGVNDTN